VNAGDDLRAQADRDHLAGVWDLGHVRQPIELGPLGYTSWLLGRIGLRGTTGRVLDAGGGDGYFGALVLAGRRHFLCDFSVAGLGKHHPIAIPTAAGLRQLPYVSSSFGAVLASDVLEHLQPEDVPAALGELSRVLAPGGVLVLNTSCWGIYMRRLQAAFGGDRSRLDRYDREDGHHNRFAEPELSELIHKTGLRVEWRVHYKHLFQPLLRTLVDEPLKKMLGGRRKGSGSASPIRKSNPLLRFGDWLRTAVALMDVLCFGWWLPGGATVWRLRKHR
jgi:SAM-dependent methyltransferase